MKKINYLLMFLAISLFVSCELDPDNNLKVTDTAGMIINVDQSTGKILGTPAGSDLDNAEIDFSDVELDFDVRLNLGSESGVAKYELLKSLNGGAEVALAETTSLPFNITYSTIEEYVTGLGVSASDLRIGDVFTFKVRLYQNDGDVYDFNSGQGQFSIVVNCASNLDGFYAVTAVRDDGGTWNQGVEEIIQISPGYYKTVTTGGWAAGAIAPDQGFNFNDTCNTLTVPLQGLAQGYYSNEVVGTDDGVVFPNGDMQINYEIEFSSGNRTYENTYIKQ